MNTKILGDKIKKERKLKKITQTALAGNKITRNMLSKIESGAATPSLDTLTYIASKLAVSVSYLLSEEDDLGFFNKKENIDKIYRAFNAKSYRTCINLINKLSFIDNELALILAYSNIYLAREAIKRGNLLECEKYVDESVKYANSTAFDTDNINALATLYSSIAKNIQSPLLEFDKKQYLFKVKSGNDTELYKYITMDSGYEYENQVFDLHIKAKMKIKERDYLGARDMLLDAIEIAKTDYDAFIVFSLYTDLEICYKLLLDFENAYLYSSKRISLIEAFKS